MRSPLAILLAALALGGCCFGGSLGGTPPPPPVPLPPPVAFTQDCAGLCQRTASCMTQRGEPLSGDEANCAASCMPGGAYSAMPPASFRCVTMPSCEQFDQCTGEAIGQMLAQILGGGPGPGAAPPGWPAGFPVVPGGTPIPAPAAGPVTVALLSYAGTTPDALEAQYRGALASGGWTATAPEVSPRGAHRFQASRAGSTVSISIYSDGAATLIQTMQF